MPSYRFVLRTAEDRPEAVEELGLFNDDGAIQYARRISHNRIVEVWQESRLVGRVEPPAAETQLPVSAVIVSAA